MDDDGYTVATARDVEGCATDDGMLDQLQSGYVQRAKGIMPRQGSKLPWKVLMHYEKDSKMLVDDPVDDGLLRFAATRIELAA
jgi:monooxygenase